MLVAFLVFFNKSVSSIKDSPYEGIISLIFGSHFLIYCGKFFSNTSKATDTDVEAPGDSPNKAMTVLSLEFTTSVPNWIKPLPCSSVSLIT